MSTTPKIHRACSFVCLDQHPAAVTYASITRTFIDFSLTFKINQPDGNSIYENLQILHVTFTQLPGLQRQLLMSSAGAQLKASSFDVDAQLCTSLLLKGDKYCTHDMHVYVTNSVQSFKSVKIIMSLGGGAA